MLYKPEYYPKLPGDLACFRMPLFRFNELKLLDSGDFEQYRKYVSADGFDWWLTEAVRCSREDDGLTLRVGEALRISNEWATWGTELPGSPDSVVGELPDQSKITLRDRNEYQDKKLAYYRKEYA